MDLAGQASRTSKVRSINDCDLMDTNIVEETRGFEGGYV